MMNKIKKICIVTGTRADFGLLRPLIQGIKDELSFNLQLIATGMHLSNDFGYTLSEIEDCGFNIDYKVECLMSSDSAVAISKSVGLAISGFSDAFDNLNPDLIIVLGDRTEILGAVIAATMANIPIAHLHGGELTEGAYDEGIRHSITKFSHLHFVCTEQYRKRVIQLGEQPNSVYNVGAIAVDSIKKLKLLSKKDFEQSIDFKLKKNNFLVTYHPVTLEKESPKKTFHNILSALDKLENTGIIFTYANSDKNGRIINEMIEEYVQKNKAKAIAFRSLGQMRYFSALQFVDGVLGNSSSGIDEVPYFKIPTINIGDRQKGRILSDSIIQTGITEECIAKSLQKALNKDFCNVIQNQKLIYGEGNTSNKIMDILKQVHYIDIKKRFFDLSFEY